jgi:hypothetical protein
MVAVVTLHCTALLTLEPEVPELAEAAEEAGRQVGQSVPAQVHHRGRIRIRIQQADLMVEVKCALTEQH